MASNLKVIMELDVVLDGNGGVSEGGHVVVVENDSVEGLEVRQGCEGGRCRKRDMSELFVLCRRRRSLRRLEKLIAASHGCVGGERESGEFLLHAGFAVPSLVVRIDRRRRQRCTPHHHSRRPPCPASRLGSSSRLRVSRP